MSDAIPDYARLTLLWLAEQVTEWEDIERQFPAPCSRCKHDRRDHVVNGDADNPSPWPCNFPQTRGAPAILCYCADYEPIREDPDDG